MVHVNQAQHIISSLLYFNTVVGRTVDYYCCICYITQPVKRRGSTTCMRWQTIPTGGTHRGSKSFVVTWSPCAVRTVLTASPRAPQQSSTPPSTFAWARRPCTWHCAKRKEMKVVSSFYFYVRTMLLLCCKNLFFPYALFSEHSTHAIPAVFLHCFWRRST